MKTSDKDLIRLLKSATKKQIPRNDSGWIPTAVILTLAILAFLYENAGRLF